MPTGLDLKQIAQWKDAQWKQFQKVTQNWDGYEKKVREAVRQLDLKSQQARKASESRLKEVSQQIQKTRGDVERRVKGLLEDEAKKLNVRLRDIYSYLVKVAQKEKKASSKVKTRAASAKSAKGKTKATAPRKTRAKATQADAVLNTKMTASVDSGSLN